MDKHNTKPQHYMEHRRTHGSCRQPPNRNKTGVYKLHVNELANKIKSQQFIKHI